jgi:hypothetical protein
MDWVHLIYELPAVAAGTVLLAYLLPWKLQPRFAPLLLFCVALAVMKLPPWIDLALAMTIPAAYLLGKLGVDLHSHEPLRIKLTGLKPLRVPLQEFAKRAYPDPAGVSETPSSGETEDQETAEVPGPAAHQEGRPRSFVPSLLG